MKILFGIAAFLVAFVLIGLIISFPVMWLWNWLMPVIFGLPVIDVFQAFGLYLITQILFNTNRPEK